MAMAFQGDTAGGAAGRRGPRGLRGVRRAVGLRLRACTCSPTRQWLNGDLSAAPAATPGSAWPSNHGFRDLVGVVLGIEVLALLATEEAEEERGGPARGRGAAGRRAHHLALGGASRSSVRAVSTPRTWRARNGCSAALCGTGRRRIVSAGHPARPGRGGRPGPAQRGRPRPAARQGPEPRSPPPLLGGGGHSGGATGRSTRSSTRRRAARHR